MRVMHKEGLEAETLKTEDNYVLFGPLYSKYNIFTAVYTF